MIRLINTLITICADSGSKLKLPSDPLELITFPTAVEDPPLILILLKILSD